MPHNDWILYHLFRWNGSWQHCHAADGLPVSEPAQMTCFDCEEGPCTMNCGPTVAAWNQHLNDLARRCDLFIDNAATASQNTSLADDEVTREAIRLNVFAPMLSELVAVANASPSAADALTDEMVEAAQDAYDLEDGLNGISPMRTALEAALSKAPVPALTGTAIPKPEGVK